MNTNISVITVMLTMLAVIAGCGTTSSSPLTAVTDDTSVDVDGSLYVLSSEPEGAVGVIEARESVDDGSSLVLVGRIGGTADPWIKGRAAFTLLDASMAIVADGEKVDETEVCIGDCCATERLSCTTLVKVVDTQGKLVPVDSRKLLGLKEADMVVVQGTAKKDKSGNFVMLANGVFVRR